MKKVSILAASAALGLAVVLGIAAPSTAASSTTASSTQVAATASTGIARAAACIVGIEYWQTSEWNPFQGYTNYFGHAKNCSSSNIRIQFLKVGGAQFGDCYTVKPGQTKTLQSTGPFSGTRRC
jgi:hypothetical protein